MVCPGYPNIQRVSLNLSLSEHLVQTSKVSIQLDTTNLLRNRQNITFVQIVRTHVIISS